MQKVLVAASAAALLFTTSAWAQTSSSSSASSSSATSSQTLSKEDQQFVEQASRDNLAEVQLGQLALQRATSPAVKEFGRWMISAHGLANRSLASLLQQMQAPAPQPTPNAEQQSQMQKLQGLSGAQFEQAYLQTMVQDHQKDVQELEKQVNQLHNPMIKTFVQNLLPALHEHLAQAQELLQMASAPAK